MTLERIERAFTRFNRSEILGLNREIAELERSIGSDSLKLEGLRARRQELLGKLDDQFVTWTENTDGMDDVLSDVLD